MPLYYESEAGYYYEVKRGKTRRISVKKIMKEKDGYDYNNLKKGVKVQIIVKPYKNGKKVTGIIKKVLTRKKIHTRGHKVMLEDGTVGRMIKIL